MTAVFASQPVDGVKPAYPFAEWLDGRQWVLIRGRDFWGDPAQLVRSLEASARARRLRVTTAVDASCLYVRASRWDPAGEDHS